MLINLLSIVLFSEVLLKNNIKKEPVYLINSYYLNINGFFLLYYG